MNLPIIQPSDSPSLFVPRRSPTIALVGNPNVGKTSLFNRLTSALSKTSNFAGTTIEHREGTCDLSQLELPADQPQSLTVIDLPGTYTLEGSSFEERVTAQYLHGERDPADVPAADAILLVVDATNLQRSLFIAQQVLDLGKPTVVAVNQIDVADKSGLEIDVAAMSKRLGCPVVAISARTGLGLDTLEHRLLEASEPGAAIAPSTGCSSGCNSCPYAAGHHWAADLAGVATKQRFVTTPAWVESMDHWLTHPIVGAAAFFAAMLMLFGMVFWLATLPMELLEWSFATVSLFVESLLPEGDFQSLIADGVISGVGGVLVFLPQIIILFFVLTLLEDSGYLARAVVVVDRWMQRVGLPGQAFVPLLTAHACAIPAIMSTRVISDRRDRLVSILVIPLMTCSARLPVYTMIAALLFPDSPLSAALLFSAAYFLGMIAAFTMALVFKMSILPGKPSPLILELPAYRRPSVSNAARHALDKGWGFLRDAGTTILLISLVIWALSTYPKATPEFLQQQTATELRQNPDLTSDSQEDLERLQSQIKQEHSALGRIGKTVQPVFEPLGFDWKVTVGVMASFAAREVVVSTLSILYGLGDDVDDDQEIHSLTSRLRSAQRADGSKVFDTATSVSLLVFFVLAMQCLPTQVVTRKETGSWRWAFFQLGYMTILAYAMAFLARQGILALGLS